MRTTLIIFLIGLFSLGLYAQKNQKPQYRQQFYNGLIKLDKSYFNYKKVTQSQVIFDTIHIINNSKQKLELSFSRVPKYITLKTEPKILKPKQKGLITIAYDASKVLTKDSSPKWGKDYKRIPVSIKGVQSHRNRRTDFITFRAFITEDFSHLSKKELRNAPIIKFDTLVYNFGTVPQGTIIDHRFIFTNKGKDNLKIRYAHAC